MNGELDKSNSVVYDEVLRMKEKHYPAQLIQRNKDKVDYYNGYIYRVVRQFVDDPIDDDIAMTGNTFYETNKAI